MAQQWFFNLLVILGVSGCACEVRAADTPTADVDDVVTLLDLVLEADEATARKCLGVLTTSLQNGAVEAGRVAAIRMQLADRLAPIIQEERNPLRFDAALLAAAWRDREGLRVVRERLVAPGAPEAQRLAALNALVAVRDPAVLDEVARTLSDGAAASIQLRGQFLAALGRVDDPRVADVVLPHFAQLEPELQPRALELLTQRPAWSKALLTAIADKHVDKEALNLNQLRRIASFKDAELQQQFKDLYGAVREGRNPDREQVYWKMRDFLAGTPGDPHAGVAVFKKVCAQCHKIYGEGVDVGPDITRNGRNNWEQLVWNVLDPSQVIGPGYQARLLLTADGRILTGLPVEETDQRVVLKIQGGKLETIPRDQIEDYKVSEISMMPDQLEKQLTPQELADLFAYLALDRPPGDPQAKILSGAPPQKAR